MMLIEPISKPVPSHGDTVTSGASEVTTGVSQVMLERDADVRLAAGAACDGAAPDLVYWLTFLSIALSMLEGLVLAEHLHERRKEGVGGARRVRVGDLHLAFVFGLGEIGPAFRRFEPVLLLEQVGVVAEAERAEIDADRLAVARSCAGSTAQSRRCDSIGDS